MNDLKEDTVYQRFIDSYRDLKEATALTRQDKAVRLVSQVDLLSHGQEGIKFLYEQITGLVKADFFQGTVWHDASRLVPSLVNGTLKSGSPNSSYELLSELRMLAVARGKLKLPKVSSLEAEAYLEEVMIHNLEFVFQEPTEESRAAMAENELKKCYQLFVFLFENSNLQGIKEKLSEEITLVTEQRPVVTRRVREVIKMIHAKIKLDPTNPADQVLLKYQNAVYSPSRLAGECGSHQNYQTRLTGLSTEQFEEECEILGAIMRSTGLVSTFHASLVKHILINQKQPELLSKALKLDDTGKAEWLQHQKFVGKLILEIIHSNNNQFLYGLAKMLEKGMFSRQAVRAGLDNMRRIRLNSLAEKAILKSMLVKDPEVNALQYLLGALIRVLGQPLGVGQGNNPTCQSARGISMWSQHAPAKLINLVIMAATQNNLIFRFEGAELESKLLGQGLVETLDYNLDAVSVILVPKIDKIYNEMMKRAFGRADDPHKWVNPALYGQWVPIGFASVYNYALNAIQDYKGFIRLLYASCHPSYNGKRNLVYPVPIGIYITSSKGDFIGFHAISLLRVKKDPDGIVRAYFLNPNNEGRQDWGQNIKPGVFGKGEKRGESSLPFDQFASRVYAFHYNSMEANHHIGEVPLQEIDKVEKMAKESWGRSYMWNEIPKQW